MLCGVLMVRRALISLHVHHITLLALLAIWYLLMGIMRRHTRDQGGMEEAGTSPGHRRTTFISDIRYIAAAMAATAHHAVVWRQIVTVTQLMRHQPPVQRHCVCVSDLITQSASLLLLSVVWSVDDIRQGLGWCSRVSPGSCRLSVW